jgi:hypothetical protein
VLFWNPEKCVGYSQNYADIWFIKGYKLNWRKKIRYQYPLLIWSLKVLIFIFEKEGNGSRYLCMLTGKEKKEGVELGNI